MQPDFYVDTHMSSEYSCRLLSAWSVEDAEFSPTFQQGKNATAFHRPARLCRFEKAHSPPALFRQDRRRSCRAEKPLSSPSF